ncbi:uncharacterized protein [Spinacia oleracea]|nr:uncharacterized protein LOC110794213 isoform X2 [Spinacia oleracea]XP_021854865.1 uncharacterized protein LOC110794213 isoform X2 [Spinacia oleracea]XP_056686452.1 uncharacterized protein LOC110794213 isoform X2 [Spinacia oleracea]
MGTRITAAASNNAVERCNQILVSWIINSVSHNISRKIWQNEQSHNCAISDGSFPGASSSPSRFIIDSPGRKVADRQPNGYLPNQNGVHNVNPNDAGNGRGANIHHNHGNGGPVMNGIGGNHGGNGNGNGNGAGAGNEGNGGEPITINRYNAHNEYIETIQTQIIANNYGSWNAFAGAICHLWHELNDDPVPTEILPLFCWPGSISVFGRRQPNDDLHSVDFDVLNLEEWGDVRELINYLRLVELDQPGNIPIIIHRYNANIEHIETFNSEIIANGYGSWNDLARDIFQIWKQRNLNVNEPEPEIAQMNPDLCWPGSMTCFGIHVFGQLVFLIWPYNPWESVRGVINCLHLFENAQHGN